MFQFEMHNELLNFSVGERVWRLEIAWISHGKKQPERVGSWDRSSWV